jgi:gliding motility-associated-like protein
MKKLLPLLVLLCLATSSIFAQTADFVAAISNDQRSCTNTAFLKAFEVGTSGTGPFQFRWSTGQTTDTIRVASGNYTVTVTNSANIQRIVSATIRRYIIPEITPTNPNLTCASRTVTMAVNGTGNYGFVWTDTQSSQNPRTVTTAGTYTVTVTSGPPGDDVRCSASITIANLITDEVVPISITRCPNSPQYCFNADGTDCVPIGAPGTVDVVSRTYTKPDGCDKKVIVTIDNTRYETNDVGLVLACDSYTVPGTVPAITHMASGTYTDELPEVGTNGCKKFVRTTLRIGRSYDISVIKYICSGDVYTVGNTPHTTTGNYVDSLKSVLITACDSIIRTRLIVDVPGTQTITARRCSSFCIGTGANRQCFTQTETRVFPGTTRGGCDSTITYAVTIAPSISVGPIVIGKCPGESYTSGTGATAITYTVPGIYTPKMPSYAYADGSGGCDSTTTIDFRIITPDTSTLRPKICSGGDFTIGTGSNRLILTTTGVYEYKLKSYGYQGGTGCDSIITTVRLTVSDLTVVPYTSYGICDGRTTGNILLTASGGITPYVYSWSTGTGNTPYRYCLAAGDYTVTVAESSASGCSYIKTFTIFTDDPSNCLNNNEGFSPDGDPFNETWQIPCIEGEKNNVYVYNRWGQLLFEKEDYMGTWNGTAEDKPLPDGTYYYVIKTKARTYRGTLTIIRQ